MLGVRSSWLSIPRPGGTMRLLVLRPRNLAGPAAAGVLWIHGGGYATGMASLAYFSRALGLAKRCGAVVVSPAYRLSGRAPYPAALEDCYLALRYVYEHAAQLGFPPERLMVGGESAGGGLAAAVCMAARDRGQVRVACQFPLYPMLDDRDTPSSRDNHAPVWNTRRNHKAWRQYLRDLPAGEPVPPYAAPARQTDYHGLPPAYTFVGDIEPFYDETLTFIDRLNKAGVPARVDVYHAPGPGCFHSFDMLTPWRTVSRQAIRVFEARFREAVDSLSD